MVDAVLFDLANTLLDFGDLSLKELFSEGCRDTYAHLATLGVELPTFKFYAQAHLRAFQRRYFWSHIRRRDFDSMHVMIDVLNRLSIKVSPHEYRALAWMWYRPAAIRSQVDSGAHDVLKHLRRQGIKMAIISNTCVPGCCLDRHLEKEGLLEYFPTRIYSSNTLFRKPHPEIFRLALEGLGIAADRAIFVGDLLWADIRGAQRAGMRTIWKPGIKVIKRRGNRHRADRIIDDLGDLQHILPEWGVAAWAAA